MRDGIDLEDYRSSIHLDEPYFPPANLPFDFEQREAIVDELLGYLYAEQG